MLRNSVVVVRTRPRAIPLAMITMRKILHGFPFLSHDAHGAPLGGPSGRWSSAMILLKVPLNSFPLNGCTLGSLQHVVRKYVAVMNLLRTLFPISSLFYKVLPLSAVFLNMHLYIFNNQPLPMSAVT